MTYNVSSGTLNPTIPILYLYHYKRFFTDHAWYSNVINTGGIIM